MELDIHPRGRGNRGLMPDEVLSRRQLTEPKSEYRDMGCRSKASRNLRSRGYYEMRRKETRLCLPKSRQAIPSLTSAPGETRPHSNAGTDLPPANNVELQVASHTPSGSSESRITYPPRVPSSTEIMTTFGSLLTPEMLAAPPDQTAVLYGRPLKAHEIVASPVRPPSAPLNPWIQLRDPPEEPGAEGSQTNEPKPKRSLRSKLKSMITSTRKFLSRHLRKSSRKSQDGN